MLVYLNDMLSSGYIPDLYTPDDTDNIINAIRPEVKAAGLMDSRDNNWNFFIDRVRKNLHTVLCMSPVGPNMRNRCRKFPALTSCTVIDWFHSWPTEALISVAMRFLGEVEMASVRHPVSIPRPLACRFALRSCPCAFRCCCCCCCCCCC